MKKKDVKAGKNFPPAVGGFETQSSFWLPKWVSLLGLLAWIFCAGKAYFIDNGHAPAFAVALEPILNNNNGEIVNVFGPLLLTHLGHVLWTSAFLFTAFHAGDSILRKLGVQDRIGLLEACTSAGLGFFVLSMIVFALLSLKALYTPVLLSIFSALLLLSLNRQKRVYVNETCP